MLLVSVNTNSETIKTYSYNQRDQVVSIASDADPNNPITFTYDDSGNRTSKTHNGVLTEYKWKPALNRFVIELEDRIENV